MQQNIEGFLVYFFVTLVLSAIHAIIFAALYLGSQRSTFFVSIAIVFTLLIVLYLIMHSGIRKGPRDTLGEFVIFLGLVSIVFFVVIVVVGLRASGYIGFDNKPSFFTMKTVLLYMYRISPFFLMFLNVVNVFLLEFLSVSRQS